MDPLCRPLTLPEQAWLAQSSLISLVGQVHTLNKDTLISAVSTARSRNPYLNVAINTTELKYERNETIPITSETMDTLFSQGSIHTIVQHQLPNPSPVTTGSFGAGSPVFVRRRLPLEVARQAQGLP